MNAIIGAVDVDIYNAWCIFSMSSESERDKMERIKEETREREEEKNGGTSPALLFHE